MSMPTTINRDELPLPMHRFTVEQYHRMIDAGVLTEDDRVELLEGWIVEKMPHTPPHDGTILAAQTELLKVIPASHVLRIQSAITLADSEPEPDLAVAQGPLRRYFEEHPGPRDLALVVEVAAATLDQDRGIKQRIYARARIPVYWIVNLLDGLVEVYTNPRAGKSPAYRQRQDLGGKDTVSLVIDGKEVARIPVRDLLP
jgi:Uma2 family endonuclease